MKEEEQVGEVLDGNDVSETVLDQEFLVVKAGDEIRIATEMPMIVVFVGDNHHVIHNLRPTALLKGVIVELYQQVIGGGK